MARSAQLSSNNNLEISLHDPVDEIHAYDNGFDGLAANDQPLALRSPSTAAALSEGATAPALRQWTERAYSAARQYVGERLGLRTRSTYSELDEQVAKLRQTREDYEQMLATARLLVAHVGGLLTVQRRLASTFAELARAATPTATCQLREDFACSQTSHDVLVANGERLLGDLNRLVSSLNTLCNTAMTDTMDTVTQYESSRLVYDARRNEYEAVAALPPSSASTTKLEEAKAVYETHRLKYEDMCSTLSAKLKFLDDNRLKVMRRDLVLLHNATSAYFSGNKADFERQLSQYSMTLRQPHGEGQSWLEK